MFERNLTLPVEYVADIVARALQEDLGQGDVTTDALISPEVKAEALLLVKGMGVAAGLGVADAVFRKVDGSVRVKLLFADGARVKPGDILARISGPAASLLKAERTALNFLQRLSGIATETARYVDAVAGLRAAILDTRKTTPGLRLLEKYAVAAGGGRNHRLNLGDMVLIKDNHIAVLRGKGLSLKEIIARVRQHAPAGMKIEVEVTRPEEAVEAASAGADLVMLDNMPAEEMRRAVRLVSGKAKIEASGGITLANVRAVAEAGVDYISVGALTHSVKALDISLELEFGVSGVPRQ